MCLTQPCSFFWDIMKSGKPDLHIHRHIGGAESLNGGCSFSYILWRGVCFPLCNCHNAHFLLSEITMTTLLKHNLIMNFHLQVLFNCKRATNHKFACFIVHYCLFVCYMGFHLFFFFVDKFVFIHQGSAESPGLYLIAYFSSHNELVLNHPSKLTKCTILKRAFLGYTMQWQTKDYLWTNQPTYNGSTIHDLKFILWWVKY